MSAPDLAYNTQTLSLLGSRLQTITDDLKNDDDLKEYNREDVNVDRVAEAIDDFVNDWDDKRNQLVKKVEALMTMTVESLEKLQEADNEVAAGLRSES